MTLEWTTDRPTVEGWYWARTQDGETVHVHVSSEYDAELEQLVITHANDYPRHWNVDELVSWAGPLLPPE